MIADTGSFLQGLVAGLGLFMLMTIGACLLGRWLAERWTPGPWR